MSRRIRLVAALVVLATLVAAGGAYAYYSARGTGRASTVVGTLSIPTITDATPGAGTVALRWSPVTAPDSGTVTYYVRRDGGAASAACPSLAAPTTATSCTDTGVSTGAHRYTVTAVWRSWTGTSATADVTVSYGPVSQLVFTTQPTGATGGTAFTTQPVVVARDASGNTVLDYAGTVTLSPRGGTGGATLSSCSGSLANGVTTFSGCKIDLAGTRYALRATDGTRTVDSTTFDVAVGPIAQLAFTTQPAGAVAGRAFTTQPVVTAQDAGGNTVTSYTSTVNLGIVSGTGAPGATLDNCSGVRANRGVAAFSSCEIKRSGTGYQLRASDGTRTATSAAFNVAVGSLDDFVFTTQPVGGTAGTAFPTQPVLTAVDAEGNTITNYAGTVTLALTSGSGLTGCTSTRSSGVITFSGCTLNQAGTFRLRARDGFTSSDSSSFTVTPGPLARLALDTDTTITAGDREALTITAVDAFGNTVTSYTGAKTLTFSGASSSLTGVAPTVTNNRGAATAFGTGTAITFTSGVASVSGMSSNGYVVLTKAEGASIVVTDGAVSSDGFATTVSAGGGDRVAWTSVSVSAGTIGTCYFTCTVTGMANRGTFTAALIVTDAYGNPASDVGRSHDVTVSRTSGTGTFSGGGSSTVLTMPSSGAAITRTFTFTIAGTGSVSNALSAASRDFTSATASLSR